MIGLPDFAREVNQNDEHIDLGRASFLLAGFEYPDLDVDYWIGQLDSISRNAKSTLARTTSSALGLGQFLFDHLAFGGNRAHYNDPRNSFLNDVLTRRLGIPISLSVVYLEVAKRLDIPAVGIGLPGHFLIRAELRPGSSVFIDGFAGGMVMDADDCRRRVSDMSEGKMPWRDSYLDPVGPRYVLTRMLNNLKNIYAGTREFDKALSVVQRLLQLDPLDATEMRNLAAVYSALNQKRLAIQAYERYLTVHPGAPDADQVRDHLRQLAETVARWN